MAPTTAARDTVINLRADGKRRALIDRAASLVGKSRTEFVLEAAAEKAQQVLLDRTLFVLDSADFKRFGELLDAPLAKGTAIKRLLSRRAPWERRSK
jgi:uncharacterized protein (DUF1778 family)